MVIASRCPYFEELLSALPSNSVCQVECKLEIFSIMLKFIYYNHWAAPRVQQSRRKVDANFCCCGCIAMRKQIHHPFKTPSAQSTIRSKHHPLKAPSAQNTIHSKHHPLTAPSAQNTIRPNIICLKRIRSKHPFPIPCNHDCLSDSVSD